MTSLEIVKRFYPEVERVKDAKKDVEITVTKGDSTSTKGIRNHNDCALARACKRALRLDGVIVSMGTVYTVRGDEALRYRVPVAVSRELVAFDRGASFEPGEYTLKQPDRMAPRPRKPETKERNSVRRHSAPRHVTSGVRASLLSA